MSYLDGGKLSELRSKLTSDEKKLKRIYRAKSDRYHKQSVVHSMVDDLLEDDWEQDGDPLKYKTKLKKPKSHSRFFEDQIWCQMYDLGFRTLNVDENFHLPFGKGAGQSQQIDVIAVSSETILIIECKSKRNRAKSTTIKSESEGLRQKIDGFRKSTTSLLGGNRKLKYIYATRNIKIDPEGTDAQRLYEAGAFLYTDSTYDYVQGLIKSYKSAAEYQFHALIFSGTSISKEKIEVPALQGNMGGETYYMFSIEPSTLLKLSFVLHRTRANEAELPTYQRLLVPSRLNGISKFINGGGYFPNSLIVNFNEKKHKLEFQSSEKSKSSKSKHGILKIPNAYAIAYLIDGQHRLYGYSQSDYKETNTIPVVAFKNLDPTIQLKLFMDINENQKAVSPTLRITLEEDLFWQAERLDSRMKALRSSVIRLLATSEGSPLYRLLSIGEDKAELSSKPFANALSKSSLIPKATQSKFAEGAAKVSLYNSDDTNHDREMKRARKRIYSFIALAYDFVIEQLSVRNTNTYILSNRGTFGFISLIANLNKFMSEKGLLSPTSSPEERIDAQRKYLKALCEKLDNLDEEEESELTEKLGQGADTLWLRKFQSFVSQEFPDYNPSELTDWRERQDEVLQEEARKLGTQIERALKQRVLSKLQCLYGSNWELEIASIKRECDRRVSEQQEKSYKEGLPVKDMDWTEQFFITDYKKIIEAHWTKTHPERREGFKTFQEEFAIDLGLGAFNSKSEKTKWLSLFNSWRNSWAHEGTKDKGLNSDEVSMVRKIHREIV
ncbi:DGQHR domain-containing protein [Fretibacter rubidus]|uniref:DGQHR domain-containing protein n=1 Tax=Fretibacter rubidus TaxID=570162 RepID=UPI00352AF8A5